MASEDDQKSWLVDVGRRTWCALALILGTSLPLRAETLLIYAPSIPPLLELRDGRPAGPLLDWLRKVEALSGDQYVLELVPWARALECAKRGEGAVWGISYTEERAVYVQYSRPTFHVVMNLVALRSRHLSVRGPADLKGLRVAVIRGASYGAAFDRAVAEGRFEVVTEARQAGLLRLVLDGQADVAVLADGQRGLTALLKRHAQLQSRAGLLEVLPGAVVNDALALAVPRSWGRSELLERFNAAVARVGPLRPAPDSAL